MQSADHDGERVVSVDVCSEVKLTHREDSRHYRVWTTPGSVVKAEIRMRATVEWLQSWPRR